MDQSTQIPTFQLVKQIGEGACSKVFLANEHLSDGSERQIALKVIADRKFHTAGVFESRLLKDIDHPCILRVEKCFQSRTGDLILVQEYAPNGDLFSVIESKQVNEANVRRHMAQIIAAVDHLHSNGIVHRDIKPDNILLDHGFNAKLCDFGMADYQDARVFSGRGTLPYMAPEIIACKTELHADKSHDVWALGVTLFVLLTGSFPFESASPDDRMYQAFVNAQFARIPAWLKLSPDLLRFYQDHIFVPQERRCSAATMKLLFSFAWTRDSKISVAHQKVVSVDKSLSKAPLASHHALVDLRTTHAHGPGQSSAVAPSA